MQLSGLSEKTGAQEHDGRSSEVACLEWWSEWAQFPGLALVSTTAQSLSLRVGWGGKKRHDRGRGRGE